MARNRLTQLEIYAIGAILRVGEDAYGVRIAEEIAERTGRDVAIGTLYRTLNRLEEKGFLSSTMGEATAERGGRAKTFYRVEGAGVDAFRESVADLRALIDGLDLGWGS